MESDMTVHTYSKLRATFSGTLQLEKVTKQIRQGFSKHHLLLLI